MRIKILFIFFFLSFVFAKNDQYVVITYNSTPIKVLPHVDAYKLGVVQKGDSFKVLYKEGDWYHIEFNKLPAWVHSRYAVEKTVADTVKEKEPSSPPPPTPPEETTITSPVQEKSTPATQKPPEPAPQQNEPKKITEVEQPKKPSVKSPSKPQREVAVKQSVPVKKSTIPKAMKKSDTALRRQDSQPRAVSTQMPVTAKEKPSVPIPSRKIILFVCAAACLILVASFSLRKLRRFRERQPTGEPSESGMEALIIAKSKMSILNTLTNSSMEITEFLSEMGFKVHFYMDLSNAKTHLLHYMPDVVVVDWQLEQDIESSIALILSGIKTTANIAVIFYNVPNPSSMTYKADAHMHAYYFGIKPSDQDISKIIVPIFKLSKKEKKFTESVQANALEGEIQKGNLAEVLQFIEMGKKTGCLYVVVDLPYGLIYFEQGKILFAVSPADQGKNAILYMLDLTKGYFHFVMDKSTPQRNCNHSCLEIVAEWTRLHDEAALKQQQGAPGSNPQSR